MTGSYIRVGIDLARQGGRLATRAAGTLEIVDGEPTGVPTSVNGLPRGDALQHASSPQEWAAVERLHDILFQHLRSHLPDIPAPRAIISVPSFLGADGVGLLERCARRADFRQAQTVAEPTAVAIEYAATRTNRVDAVVAVACMALLSFDVGVFKLTQGKVLPLGFSGGGGPQPDTRVVERVWRDCWTTAGRGLHGVDAMVVAGPLAVSPSVVQCIERLTGVAADRMPSNVDAVVLGALRCAEVVDWEGVIPIREG